jgi:hypothetical protein
MTTSRSHDAPESQIDRSASGRDCTLRATCVQKTTCSDLSQIKYVRWSSALQGRWGVYWLRAVSLNQGGRAVETGMGNALVIK